MELSDKMRKRIEKKLRKAFSSEGYEPFEIEIQSHNILSPFLNKQKVSFHLQIRTELKEKLLAHPKTSKTSDA